MSYCRFSSMNWKCEVYVYENVHGGWTTHVAGNKRIFSPIPDILNSSIGPKLHKWSGGYLDPDSRKMVYPIFWKKLICSSWVNFSVFWHRHIHMKSLSLIPRKNIGLPQDGKTFHDDTAKECADTLEWLQSLGYVVPKKVIEELRNEESSNITEQEKYDQSGIDR